MCGCHSVMTWNETTIGRVHSLREDGENWEAYFLSPYEV